VAWLPCLQPPFDMTSPPFSDSPAGCLPIPFSDVPFLFPMSWPFQVRTRPFLAPRQLTLLFLPNQRLDVLSPFSSFSIPYGLLSTGRRYRKRTPTSALPPPLFFLCRQGASRFSSFSPTRRHLLLPPFSPDFSPSVAFNSPPVHHFFFYRTSLGSFRLIYVPPCGNLRFFLYLSHSYLLCCSRYR